MTTAYPSAYATATRIPSEIEALEARILAAIEAGISPAWEDIRRLYFHGMRRAAPVGIVVNTSRRRIVECAICGESESCCNDYPETARVVVFREQHNDRCLADWRPPAE